MTDYATVTFDTVGVHWWRFVNGEPDRPLTDREAAEVIWATDDALFARMIAA